MIAGIPLINQKQFIADLKTRTQNPNLNLNPKPEPRTDLL